MKDVVESFMAKIMAWKRSAPAIRYRLDRLTAIIGDKKISDVTRQDVIAALYTIAEGQRKGKTAKQLSGEVLTKTKQLHGQYDNRTLCVLQNRTDQKLVTLWGANLDDISKLV